MNIELYIDKELITVPFYRFYEYMCSVSKNSEVALTMDNLKLIQDKLPEYLPNKHFGTVAGINLNLYIANAK